MDLGRYGSRLDMDEWGREGMNGYAFIGCRVRCGHFILEFLLAINYYSYDFVYDYGSSITKQIHINSSCCNSKQFKI